MGKSAEIIMEKNLTEGSILKNILSFSFPFFLSYFLQTLYGMADVFIAGQFNGAEVITAVSVGSQLMHMVTVIIVGLASGGFVLIGQSVGAKCFSRAAKVTGNTISFFLIFSIVTTIILLFASRGIVFLISTPAESVEQTLIYLRICFAGIPFITGYNVISAIYRGTGDSKTPMLFVAVACFFNILLDFLFMGLLNLKAGGAALATVISQALSVIFGLISMMRSSSKSGIKIKKSDFVFEKSVLGGILKIGFPIACQDGFVQISFMLITVIANRRGVEIAAAVGIVEKIITFLFLVPSTMLSTVSAISAQNVGAGKYDRAEKTLFTATGIALTIGAVFAIFFQFCSHWFLSFFTENQVVVNFGEQYLKSYVFDCIFAAIHFSFGGYFTALGKSIFSFINNTISIIFVRIPGAFLASKFYPETLYPMGWAAPLGSALSSLICIFFFIIIKKFLNSRVKN